ncbi:hypothetical protein P7K49_007879 [Saguinus oedipus]|uniref:Uncharacterized protein n=1 Tax=Saguinus oedipus TaxID=9490 RepID=A0ABQ9VW25_SAGOE|nr:hypothetical protein P7K49_007879 [Saguinus oedipus]
MWKILTFSSQLYQKTPKTDVAVDQQYLQVLPMGIQFIPWEPNKENPGRGRRPGILLAKVLFLFLQGLQNLFGNGEGTSPIEVQSQLTSPCKVHSSVLGATMFCLFSRYFFSPNFSHFALES